jgi:hypothetical protein
MGRSISQPPTFVARYRAVPAGTRHLASREPRLRPHQVIETCPRIVYASGGCPGKGRRTMPRAARRTLLSAVLFGALLFGEIEAQAAGNLWVYQSCANWVQYHSLETVRDQMPTPGARLGRCSRERIRMACRLAVAGAPVQGLKLCPDELCPTIGRALRGLGVAAMPRGQLLTVYKLCPQQW